MILSFAVFLNPGSEKQDLKSTSSLSLNHKSQPRPASGTSPKTSMKSELKAPTSAELHDAPARPFTHDLMDHWETRRVLWADPQISMSGLILEAVVRRLRRTQLLQQTCDSLWLWHVVFVGCRSPRHVFEVYSFYLEFCRGRS